MLKEMHLFSFVLFVAVLVQSNSFAECGDTERSVDLSIMET